MDELLRAVKAINDALLDEHKSVDGIMAGNLNAAFTATVAEIRKRRAESPWRGPFKPHCDDGVFVIADSLYDPEYDVVCDAETADNARLTAAALNSFYGYHWDGAKWVDVIEGMEP